MSHASQPQPGSSPVQVNFAGDNTGLVNVSVSGPLSSSESEELLQLGFEDVMPPFFPSPKGAATVVATLARERLVVLGGQRLAEKDRLACHLAWLLHERLARAETTLVACQLHASKLTSRIELKRLLSKRQSGVILVVSDLDPHQVQFDLRLLRDLAKSLQSYFIVTTETKLKDWHLGPESPEASLLIEANEEDWFDGPYLTAVLRGMLEVYADEIPAGLGSPGSPVWQSETLCGRPVLEISKRLRSPGQVRELVEWLRVQIVDVDAEKLNERLDLLGGQTNAVKRWFQQLSLRQQLLATAAALFEGVLDDQFFALLELLWKAGWQERLARPLFDYEDLRPLQTYFQGVSASSGLQTVRVFSADARRAILELAWVNHRRSVVTALAATHELVVGSVELENRLDVLERPLDQLRPGKGTEKPKAEAKKARAESASAKKKDKAAPETKELESEEKPAEREEMAEELGGFLREIFGSRERREALRSAIQHTFSRLGALAWDGLDPFLKEIAASRHHPFQRVAATALADWRSPEYRDRPDLAKKLYDKLERWNDRAFVREMLGLKLAGPEGQSESTLSCIRATVVLAVSRAAAYDPPDDLDQRLEKLFLGFLDDRNQLVQERFRSVAVPLVVSRHLHKLEGLLLRRFLPSNPLLQPVAAGIAQAYELRPRETYELLERWYEAWLSAPRVDPGAGWRIRERQLLVVLMVYGSIACSEGEGWLSLSVLYSKLERVLVEQQPVAVRAWAIEAAMRQAKRDFAGAERHLQGFIAEVTLDERDLVVRHLVAIYLEQRRRLRGGHEVFVLQNVDYEVWWTDNRPMTRVENALQRWLFDASNTVAQQVAITTLEAFAETPIDQHELKLRAKPPMVPDEDLVAALGGPSKLTSFERVRKANLWARLALWLRSAWRGDDPTALRWLFAELLHLFKRTKETRALLAGMEQRRDPDLTRLARDLKKLRLLYRLRWLLIPALAPWVYLLVNHLASLWQAGAERTVP